MLLLSVFLCRTGAIFYTAGRNIKPGTADLVQLIEIAPTTAKSPGIALARVRSAKRLTRF